MKVAIFGAYGFLGTHLTDYYLNKGYDVVRIGKDDEFEEIVNCDFLINCAGINRANTPQEVFNGNISIADDLILALELLNVKIPIKFISSIHEGNDTAYGKAKKQCKNIIKKYCDKNKVKFESYKLPNLFGTKGKPNYNSFVNTFAYNIVNGIKCNYNTNSISLCHVWDAIKVIDNQTKKYKTYDTTVENVYKTLKMLNGIMYNGFDPYNLKDFDFELYQILVQYKYPTKVFVLGHKGMLGHMVYNVLSNDYKYKVSTTNRRFPDWDSKMFEGYDYIVDCVGAVPQKTNDFSINWEIPIWLNENTNCKIIHPATDCEHDSSDYGISKRKGSDYIKDNCKSTKIIQTSIIGPEIGNKFGLMEWFLSQKGEVNGYTKAIWNGVTTYEWVKHCKKLIDNWDNQPILTILYSNKISKYKLLYTIQECYDKKDVVIMPKELGHDRTLIGDIKVKDIKEQIIELINFQNRK
tara:strand:+ start:9845 stop:11239 length:1395 start_codon:yes stop_codon:yes gene_type:complete